MMKLNDYFSKLYVINLDRRPDRYMRALREFNKIGVKVERVPGIDGKTLSGMGKLSPRERSCSGLTSTFNC